MTTMTIERIANNVAYKGMTNCNGGVQEALFTIVGILGQYDLPPVTRNKCVIIDQTCLEKLTM
jgi:hypothetical protein